MTEKDLLKEISSPAENQQPKEEPESEPEKGKKEESTETPQTSLMNSTATAPLQTMGEIDTVKQTALRDLSIVSNLMHSGIINPLQGQHLINYVLNKAQEVVNNQVAVNPLSQIQNFQTGITEFEKENPEFFKQNGRSEVLNYLKGSNVVVDKDEILQISKLIELIEQNAIKGYLQKQAHEQSLKDANEMAKAKLKANAQKQNPTDSNLRLYTREQIGKMNGAEFTKNEKAIMEQLRKGLIR